MTYQQSVDYLIAMPLVEAERLHEAKGTQIGRAGIILDQMAQRHNRGDYNRPMDLQSADDVLNILPVEHIAKYLSTPIPGAPENDYRPARAAARWKAAMGDQG